MIYLRTVREIRFYEGPNAYTKFVNLPAGTIVTAEYLEETRIGPGVDDKYRTYMMIHVPGRSGVWRGSALPGAEAVPVSPLELLARVVDSQGDSEA